MRLAHTAIAATVLLMLAAAPASAAAKTYNGGVKPAGDVRFDLTGSKVRNLVVSLDVSCSDSYYSGLRTAGPVKRIAVHGGRFSFDGDPPGEPHRLQIKGRVQGSKASGKVYVSDLHYSYDGPLGFCGSGWRKWTARVGG